jgi:Dolichyl-phosphate-mannose-protein mannosyltransferase
MAMLFLVTRLDVSDKIMGRALSSTRRYRSLIAALLIASVAIAFALRITGIGFGRGVLCPRPDEELMQSGVLNSLRGDLNPHYAVWGHLFHYCYLCVAATWQLIGLGVGRFANWTEAVAASYFQPSDLITCGRALSAIIGSLTLWAAYSLARDSSGSRFCGVLAAGLLSTLFLHVRDSHFATSDMMLAATCTAALAELTRPGGVRAGWAGFWCGLALATKLLAVTLLLTFVTCVALGMCHDGSSGNRWLKVRAAVQFLLTAFCVMLLTQPFLLLDPMETWYGWFGDLFNPERRPFQEGINLRNASIITRYYIPQAMGWSVGVLAILGAAHLTVRQYRLSRRVPVTVLYLAWSLLAILSVQRMFLRYLDPLIPAICVLAAAGSVLMGRLGIRLLELARHAFVRPIAVQGTGLKLKPKVHGFMSPGRLRLSITIAAVAAGVLPNLGRSISLDSRLLRADTRSLACDWIEQHVPAGSRVLWLGYGQIAPHITMPWLQATLEIDSLHSDLRRSRGLSTSVEGAVERMKREQHVPMYEVVGVSIGSEKPERSGLEAYPMLDHTYTIAPLQAIDRISRKMNLVRPESTRWDLMRRHVARVWETTVESIVSSGEDYVVVTGLPCDANLINSLDDTYREVQRFDPGTPWPELSRSVMYDSGDAWYLPNYGITQVDRPGPQVRIFQRRSNAIE